MEIITERLKLVPIGEQYIDDIFVNFKSNLTRYMYPKEAEQRSETEQFVHSSMDKFVKKIDFVFVVLQKNNSEFLGCMGIHHVDTLTPVLGLWIKKTAHGHGYGLEGMNALIRFAFENLTFHHLVYDVDKDNYPSRRIPILNGGVVHREYVKFGASGNRLNLVEYWLFKDPNEALQKPPVLLFQGDSITDVHRDREFAYGLGDGFVKMVQDSLPGCIVINKGISGNKTNDLLTRWEEDTVALQPNFLAILIGINEILHRYKYNRITTVEEFEANYRKLLEVTKALLPNTKLLLIEPFCFPIGAYDDRWQIQLDAEKAITKRLADEFADFYLPMDEILHEKAKEIPYETILSDGVHPTEVGHRMIANAVLEVLNPLYK